MTSPTLKQRVDLVSLSGTFIISPENKDPLTCHNFKFIVFGWSGHLDGSQWDHSFRVGILKQSR